MVAAQLASRAGEKIQHTLRLRLHDLQQFLARRHRVSLEIHVIDLRLRALHHVEHHARRARFIIILSAKTNIHIAEALALVILDNLLLVGIQRSFAECIAGLRRNLITQLRRLYARRTIDHHFGNRALRLHYHNHLHAIAGRLAENAHIAHIAGRVEIAHVLLRHLRRVGLTNASPHIGEDFFL